MRTLAITLMVLVLPSVALANPHALPFTYPYATLAEDEVEIEQYVDLTPVPTLDTSGERQKTPRAILTTELEYGLLDRLELGLYTQFSNDPGSGTGTAPLRFDGLKQRLRLRLAETGEWPVDIGLYGEIAELSNELEFEAKIILERRVGKVQLLANLWAEYELYYAGQTEWVLHPTAGASYEFSPAFHLGVEYWMHDEVGGNAPAGSFNPALHHFVGPTVLLQWPKLWWSTGAYVRLDKWDRQPELGDQFGRIWIRTVVGL